PKFREKRSPGRDVSFFFTPIGFKSRRGRYVTPQIASASQTESQQDLRISCFLRPRGSILQPAQPHRDRSPPKHRRGASSRSRESYHPRVFATIRSLPGDPDRRAARVSWYSSQNGPRPAPSKKRPRRGGDQCCRRPARNG